MRTDEFDQILRHTLEDCRLSRGEKQVLSSIRKELGDDEHQLAVLRSRAFEFAKAELMSSDAKDVVNWLEDVNKALLPATVAKENIMDVFFSRRDDCARKIVDLFHLAAEQVDVCVFTITDDRISDAIAAAFDRGVRVRIISDNDKATDVGSDIMSLERRGIPVRYDRTEFHMHHKFAVFDSKLTLTGSYNWTRSASKYNNENFIVSDDRHLMREFSRTFAKLWEYLSD